MPRHKKKAHKPGKSFPGKAQQPNPSVPQRSRTRNPVAHHTRNALPTHGRRGG